MTDIRQIAFDTLKSGAPGLSEQTREVLAGIIARKANLTAPVAETAGDAVAWVPIHPRTGPIWAESGPDARGKDNLISYPFMPLYAFPVPAQADEKLRIAVEALGAADRELSKQLGYRSSATGRVVSEALAALKAEGK